MCHHEEEPAARTLHERLRGRPTGLPLLLSLPASLPAPCSGRGCAMQAPGGRLHSSPFAPFFCPASRYRRMFKGFTRFLQSPGERLKSLFGPDSAAAGTPELRIIPRQEHPVSRQHFSDAALKVLYRLHNAGYQAYWWAAASATPCSAACPRTSTWPPTPRRKRSRRCSVTPGSSAGAFASCTCASVAR